MASEDKLKLDYEQTCQQIRAFTDIRFKLLAFVPTLTGTAVALLSNVDNRWTVLAVSLLGLFVTLGIVFYEIRNTVLYDAAIHRAKWLEVSLGLPILTYGKQRGGLFNERPPRPKLFEGSPLLKLVTKLRDSRKGPAQPSEEISEEEPALVVWHGQALALVYGAALGGWVYIVTNSLLTLLSQQRPEANGATSLVAILTAGISALWFVREWHSFDKRRDQPKPREGIW